MIDEIMIDYELFTAEEIGFLYSFYQLVEDTLTKRIDHKRLETEYKRYRHIINSIQLEKKYDKQVEKAIGISIYRMMDSLRKS
ncbi:MAG: UPF0223 family protein [Bacilli bacterium]